MITYICMLAAVVLLRYVDAVKHYPLGRSLFLPDQDILNPNFGGKEIFKKFTPDCYIIRPEHRRTEETRSRFENTEAFYKRLATDSGISVGLQGPYTMGATLNSKSRSLSSGRVDVIGTSIIISTHVSSTQLHAKCYKRPDSQLSDDLIKLLDHLPSEISQPEYEHSWVDYDNFLKTYGSHFAYKIHYGARITQWTFAKKEYNYDDFHLTVRSCANFAGLSPVGKLKVNACAGVTDKEAEESVRLQMTSYLDILGGTDETRNQLRMERNQKLITKFLNEGREVKTLVKYSYMAIWDVLMQKFSNHPTRRAIAFNMKQYYEGLGDFGCSLIQADQGDIKGKPLCIFRLIKIDPKGIPLCECRLERQGCHTDADCHIGGAGVTYCHGPSCVEYVSPPFGSKAKLVRIRIKKSGSYNKGVNRSCYYVLHGKCNQTKFSDKNYLASFYIRNSNDL